MKFRDVAKGKRARLKGVTFDGLDGSEHVFDLRLIDNADTEAMVQAAMGRARAAGVVDPKAGNPLYDLFCDQELVLRATIDAESPELAPEPYFATLEEMKGALDDDRIALLAAKQREHQDSLSPLKHSMTAAEYHTYLYRLACREDGDPDPLGTSAHSLRLSFETTMARQCLSSPLYKSPSSSVDVNAASTRASSPGSFSVSDLLPISPKEEASTSTETPSSTSSDDSDG